MDDVDCVRWKEVVNCSVDGSEIRRAAVEVGSLDHFYTFFYIQKVVVWDF